MLAWATQPGTDGPSSIALPRTADQGRTTDDSASPTTYQGRAGNKDYTLLHG